jgi:hypothetical protein
VHGAQDLQFTWYCRKFFLGARDQSIADNRCFPMHGHIGESGRHTVEVVEKRECLRPRRHQLTGIYERLQGSIGSG